jgi:hypothetical protein
MGVNICRDCSGNIFNSLRYSLHETLSLHLYWSENIRYLFINQNIYSQGRLKISTFLRKFVSAVTVIKVDDLVFYQSLVSAKVTRRCQHFVDIPTKLITVLFPSITSTKMA